MAKVITLSRVFPKYHSRAGQPTFFPEKVWRSFLDLSSPMFPYWMKDHPSGIDIRDSYDYDPKHHTIRSGKRWKDGDVASLRVWSGKPYRSTQIAIAPDVKVKVRDVEIDLSGVIKVDGHVISADIVAKNDGLSLEDLREWFRPSLPFSGQMLIWNPINLTY